MNAPDATPVALDTWPRREAYTFFSGLSDPFYSVTVTVDTYGDGCDLSGAGESNEWAAYGEL